MTQSLGLTPLAEGVESEEQLAALIEMGCAQAGGFLLGKPVFAEEFVTAWLAGPTTEPGSSRMQPGARNRRCA